MSSMKFSVITAVYNCEEYIEQTIKSVLNCIDQNITEYIVVNDGSTDKTAEILRIYASEITVITQKNLGEAESINKALNASKGEFCLVVSADDPMISSSLLSTAARIMENNSEIVCVYPNWNIIDKYDNLIRHVEVADYSELELIGKFNCLVGPGGVFRRNEALSIGCRDSKYRYVSDYDFWLRLSRKGKFFHLDETHAQWRSHDESTSLKSRGLKMGEERIEVIKEFLKTNHIERALRKRATANSYYHAALLQYFDPNVPGKKWILKALTINPKSLFEDFDLRIILYIVLYPFSKCLVPIARKLGLARRLGKNA